MCSVKEGKKEKAAVPVAALERAKEDASFYVDNFVVVSCYLVIVIL